MNRASSEPLCIPASIESPRLLLRAGLSVAALRALVAVGQARVRVWKLRFTHRARRRMHLQVRRILRGGVLATALMLIGCAPAPLIPAATPTAARVILRLYVTSSAAPLLQELAEAYRQTAPHARVDIVTSDYELTATAIQQGRMSEYLLTHHLPSDDEPQLWAAPIAQDAIVLITSGSAAPASLTLTEVRAIYQGWIDRWSQVGGDDLPIAVFVREDSSAIQAEFRDAVLGNRAVTRNARIAPGSAALIASIAQTPGAIGCVSAGALAASAVNDVRVLAIEGITPTREHIAAGLYPLRTFIYLMGQSEPEGELRAFVAWAQGRDGQAVVNRHYQSIGPMAN